jgi:hypothetical protein
MEGLLRVFFFFLDFLIVIFGIKAKEVSLGLSGVVAVPLLIRFLPLKPFRLGTSVFYDPASYPYFGIIVLGTL